jgi:hypothetical protein
VIRELRKDLMASETSRRYGGEVQRSALLARLWLFLSLTPPPLACAAQASQQDPFRVKGQRVIEFVANKPDYNLYSLSSVGLK